MSEFQRARRPEQVEARRTAILDTATAMLREKPVTEISLRELSDEVGLAKSNVLRYFDSREAIFLEVLDRTWGKWLDNLGLPDDDDVVDGDARWAREVAVASEIAFSIGTNHLLCELISVMASVLERNISVGFARTFKQKATAHTERLALMVRERIPELTPASAGHFADAVFVIVAGLWPYAQPTEAVRAVTEELGMPPPGEMFLQGLTEGLTNQLIGLVARSA